MSSLTEIAESGTSKKIERYEMMPHASKSDKSSGCSTTRVKVVETTTAAGGGGDGFG